MLANRRLGNLSLWLALLAALAAGVLPALAEPTITLKMDRRPVAEAARAIARQAGVQVRVEANTDKLVDLNIEDWSLEKALKVTAMFAGLEVRKEADGSYVLALPAGSKTEKTPNPASGDAAETIARVKPAVAVVVAYVPAEKAYAQGTGFAIAVDGLVVTNAHVVKGSAVIQVVFPDSGAFFPAVVAASDDDRDLAILRVNTTFKSWLRLGDSDQLREGDDVALTGYPMALELLRNGIRLYASTSKATVNAIRPGRMMVSGDQMPYIQIDAPVNPGNSGGPLYRVDTGQVVGVVQSKLAYDQAQDTGVSFAIPANFLRRLIGEARNNPAKPPEDITPLLPDGVSPFPLRLQAPIETPGPDGMRPDAPAVTRSFDIQPAGAAPPIPEPPATPGLIGLHAPGGKMLADPTHSRLYAADIGGNSIAAVDAATGRVLGRIFTGSKPYGLALSADGKTLYVADSGGSDICLVDTDKLAVTGRVPLSFRPFDLAMAADGRLYATAAGLVRTSIRHIDLRRNMELAVNGMPLSGGAVLASSPASDTVYAGERMDAPVVLYSAQSAGRLSTTSAADAGLLGSGLQDLELSPDGTRLYVASLSLTYVSVLDANDLRPLGQLDVGSSPTAVALSPDGKTAYVCHRKNHVDRFDTRTFLRTGSLPVPQPPLRVAVSADGKKLFVQLPGGILAADASAVEAPVPEN